MNLVIHEFAHKIDMRNGEAERLPAAAAGHAAEGLEGRCSPPRTSTSRRASRLGEHTAIDPYAAESPAEFFAVLSEVFFAEPVCFRHEYRGLYELFVRFYRQDPAARLERRGAGAPGPAPSAP